MLLSLSLSLLPLSWQQRQALLIDHLIQAEQKLKTEDNWSGVNETAILNAVVEHFWLGTHPKYEMCSLLTQFHTY